MNAMAEAIFNEEANPQTANRINEVLLQYKTYLLLTRKTNHRAKNEQGLFARDLNPKLFFSSF